MEHPSGSNPALAAETRVTNVTFNAFSDCGSRAGNVLMTTMRGGIESSDAVPPVFFEKINIDVISRTNLAVLPNPHQAWIEPTKCVVMDCDGPKHVLLHDLDGSLIGLGPDGSIIPRAEYFHERRADVSKYTWYNIPSKMVSCAL